LKGIIFHLSVCRRRPPHRYLQSIQERKHSRGPPQQDSLITFLNYLLCMLTMNPSIYSDFTSISIVFGDTPNTWMGQLLVTDIYWFFALFAWIIVTNLDLMQGWLWRSSVSVQPISEYTKGQRRIRRLHETSILLLSFGALLFLVRRQDDNVLSPPPSYYGLHPCFSVQGEHFWRCVRARSTSLPERARVLQHTRSIVGDEVNNYTDANKDADNVSSVSYCRSYYGHLSHISDYN
jgi:hypothetical protein